MPFMFDLFKIYDLGTFFKFKAILKAKESIKVYKMCIKEYNEYTSR